MGGLWAGRTTQQGDFATVAYRAQLLGFNAVRIPFRFSDLNLPPKNWTFPCSVDRLGDIKVPAFPPAPNPRLPCTAAKCMSSLTHATL